MPATAGRVKMPANNRIHSSAALRTSAIWSQSIGYDPYAAESSGAGAGAAPAGEAYEKATNLMILARDKANKQGVTAARGSCKKCGAIGHLTFQCRNFLSVKDGHQPIESSDSDYSDTSSESDDMPPPPSAKRPRAPSPSREKKSKKSKKEKKDRKKEKKDKKKKKEKKERKDKKRRKERD